MNYTAQTFSYLKKHFWLPLVIMLVPAVAACFLSTPFYEVSFVAAFVENPYVRMSATLSVMFEGGWHYLWRTFVVVLLQILAASLTMSAIDRHFRTGTLSLKTPARLLNYSIYPIFLSAVIVTATGIAFRFVLYALISLVQVIFRTTGVHPAAGVAVISVLAAGIYFVQLLFTVPMLYWAPVMFVYGYGLRDGAAASVKLLSKQKAGRGIILPMLMCAAIQMLIAFFDLHPAIDCSVSFVLSLFMGMYVTTYVILSFYKICKLERRDVMPYENLSQPTPVKVQSKQSDISDEKGKKDKKSAKAVKVNPHSSLTKKLNKRTAEQKFKPQSARRSTPIETSGGEGDAD